MSDNVVSTTDVAPLKVPKSFNDLNREQLVAAALAFGADEKGTMAEIKAELAETGVTWAMYAKAFKVGDYEELPEDDGSPFEKPVEDWDELEEPSVVTAPPTPKLEVGDKPYLIKFIGQNPYFEFGKYKFSDERPYAVMPPEDAQRALETEPEKFRQAFPKELQEFYS